MATMIWQPFCSFSACRCIFAPPYRHAMRTSGINWHKFCSSAAICCASSRVGARITACGTFFSFWMRSITGMPKAQVLPVPVGALAIISWPAIIKGMAFSCTSVISVKPIASTARRISGLTLSSAYFMDLLYLSVDAQPLFFQSPGAFLRQKAAWGHI